MQVTIIMYTIVKARKRIPIHQPVNCMGLKLPADTSSVPKVFVLVRKSEIAVHMDQDSLGQGGN
jgi:hypothetical protein